MRGKLILSDKSINQSGITPADAGKTKNEKVFHVLKQDHPRGCGENYPSDHISTKRPGSPPRMRGKRALNQAVSGIGRITPADAGKTCNGMKSVYRVRDHPRGCGENGLYALRLSKCLGSPPRMRGKQSTVVYRLNRRRITPADAGKTASMDSTLKSPEDHPRGCGENCNINFNPHNT